MKIIILAVTLMLIFSSVQHTFAIPYMSPQDLYKQSNMVFYGQVIAKEDGPGPDYYYYQVKVETYFKNHQKSDSITVAGHKPGDARSGYQQFEVGDKAIFYINKLQGINTISRYSTIAGEACDIHSFLGPDLLPGEKPPISSAASGFYLTDSNGNQINKALANHQVVLSYDDIWNNFPESRTISVETTILDSSAQTVFHKKQDVEMQACDGPRTLEWGFVPTQSENYTATVVVDNKTTISTIFEVTQDSTSLSMVEKADIQSPLKQFKSGISAENVQCKEGLYLIFKSTNEQPSCVKRPTALKLIERGWASETLLQKTWVEIDPIQCAGNPWEQDWLKSHPDDGLVYARVIAKEKIDIITSYYKKLGITIFDAKLVPWDNMVVCESCSCPAGYTQSLLVSNSDVDKMLEFGYKISENMR